MADIIGAALGASLAILLAYVIESAKARRARIKHIRNQITGDGSRTENVMALVASQRRLWWPFLRERRAPDLSHAELEGAKLHRQDLRLVILYRANLRCADLSYSYLQGADLTRADLREADLHAATMRNTRLYGANLENANLENADLRKADLEHANLAHATLDHADLRGANLAGVSLEGASIRGAVLDQSTRTSPEWRLLWQLVSQGAEEPPLPVGMAGQASPADGKLENSPAPDAHLQAENDLEGKVRSLNLTSQTLPDEPPRVRTGRN